MDAGERLTSLEVMMGRIAVDVRTLCTMIEGNGVPGMKVRLDRLEVESTRKGRVVNVIGVAMLPILLKLAYDWLVSIQTIIRAKDVIDKIPPTHYYPF